MTQALNFTTQAIDSLMDLAAKAQPLSRAGVRYLCDKLRKAEVFILPDYGQLLDRDKPSPEVPGLTFRPAFPVVALEYRAPADGARTTPGYTDCPSSKRIALAWHWSADLPAELGEREAPLGDGVAIASIYYSDEHRRWMPAGAAAHMAFDEAWIESTASTPFKEAVLAGGRVTAAQARAKRPGSTLVPLLPEGLALSARLHGVTKTLDALHADLMDEVNAYMDLCYALSCSNVGTELCRQPEALNRARIRRGNKPLKDFHILKLTGDDHSVGGGLGEGGSRRAHMRRGHIRQLRYLGEGRMTWVNAAIVRGRGFVDKAYAL